MTFYNEIKGMKVKELPTYLKPMFTIDNLKNSVKRGLDNYHAKYIETSSVDPLYHICFGGMIFLLRCLCQRSADTSSISSNTAPIDPSSFQVPPRHLLMNHVL
ncbi:UNVERIFIED_CONTAM: hypothetical protein Sangu_2109800 [Sesamum angustifolium]|uniref:Uncharacterized protein n=1 Tax=Sesamum angustifolium TaxID=2727405 RepID=A0AAW2LMZ2_9LAMI